DKGQARRWVKYASRFAALPNIILDHPVVPEILGLGTNVEGVAAALEDVLVVDGGAAEAQRQAFARMRAVMSDGVPGAPLFDPAERVLALAAAQRSPSGAKSRRGAPL